MSVDQPASAKAGTARILYYIIWPAAAGNVGWSLMTMLLDPRYAHETGMWPLSERAPRIAALGVFFVYLCVDWLYSRNPERDSPSWWENAGNALHVGCYATFSIAATFQEHGLRFLSYPLLLFFGATGAGHLFNVFRHQTHRRVFGFIANTIGFTVVLFRWSALGEYAMFVALSSAVLVWMIGILTAPALPAGR